MLLTVDVGNTNIVFGFFENDKQIETIRLVTKENRTSDELGLLLLQFTTRKQISVEDIEAIVIATVVPDVMPTLLRAVEQYIGKIPLVVDRDIFPALQCETEGKLGADRAVCCDAAVLKYGAPVLILDLGTATTFDAVSESAWYLGGCILAGMQLSADSLARNAALLPQIELQHPSTFLGLNTIEQIQIGSVSGYIGGIRYLISETIREMEQQKPVKVIATGGLASLVAPHVPEIDLVDDGLILDGLRLMYEKHCSQNEMKSMKRAEGI